MGSSLIPNSPLLKAEEANKRLVICQKCENYIKMAKICRLCKCFMPAKVRWKPAKCPDEQW